MEANPFLTILDNKMSHTDTEENDGEMAPTLSLMVSQNNYGDDIYEPIYGSCLLSSLAASICPMR